MLRRLQTFAAGAGLMYLVVLTGSHAAEQLAKTSPKLTAKQVEFFETKIRPVLVSSCYECHASTAAKVRGGLLLDTRQGVLSGGENGPVIVPGKPEESPLIHALRHDKLKMPPKSKLADKVVADFVEWVKMGAPDPRDGSSSLVTRITLEDARNWWSLKPIAKTTPPSGDGGWARSDIDRYIHAKIREQKLQPVADAEPAVLVRRLYFDLIGLPPTPAQVDEFVKEAGSNRPAAIARLVDRLLAMPQFGERWGRYWLDIARYAESNGNADNTPFPDAWRYRDYVIAALNQDKGYDQFIREQIAGDLLSADDPKTRDAQLIATGFLALTSKPRAQNNPDYRFDLIADQIDVTTRGVLAMSVMCARCHDHKFDPIPTREYYSLAGIFDSSVMLFGGKAGKAGKNAPAGGSHILSDGGLAMGVREGKVTDCKICIRGESKNQGDTAPRGFLTAPGIDPVPAIPAKQSGRLELAQWLTSRSNPLTARVAVNRIWLHLFGEGIVRSPDNFGALGERPSHPELLDYLAIQFMDNGWSTKKMIKMIVLSRTYQLSSSYDPTNYKVDPDNRLWWRMNQRRLDAEATRDAMMFVSGTLNLTPPIGSLSTFKGAKVGAPKGKGETRPAEPRHRSVYLGILRGAPLPESLAIFDVANPSLVVAQREVTTVPAQALFLMNSAFVVEQSRSLAQRLLAATISDESARVDLAYRMTMGRPATDTERNRAVAFIGQLTQEAAASRERDPPVAAWTGFCQALLASAEFRYLR